MEKMKKKIKKKKLNERKAMIGYREKSEDPAADTKDRQRKADDKGLIRTIDKECSDKL